MAKDAPQSLKKHPFYGFELDESQKNFRDAIWDKDKLIVFANARAGSGKSLIAFATANLLVEYGLYDGIVYVMFPCEESKQGYLPGDITQKSEVYFEPVYQAIIKCNLEPHRIINDESMTAKKTGDAYVKLLTSTYLRGTNFENKVVVIEEAQNGTADELKKVLTRCSDNCKVIVIGHTGQIDLQNKQRSGFARYIEHFHDEPYCSVCELTTNHRGLVSTKADELIT